jgi:S1-C subfamily serine protease
MQQRFRILPTLVVGLVGAVLGSFAMMLYASTHFTNVAGPGGTPPAVSAAPVLAGTGGSDQDRIVGAVKRVAPSVVALSVTVNGQQLVPTDPFIEFFGGRSPQQVRKFSARASGSGWVYSRTGNSALIVTNAHVVTPPNRAAISKLEVIFKNGDRVPAKVYAADLAHDLALVKVENYDKIPPALEVADSDRLQAGQWAIAIGEPFELKQSVSLGVVSGFNRDETIGDENGSAQQFKGLLQTSAPINPGNSGGPLVDAEGRLIGVNQSTANPQAGAQGIGFAIPANTVKLVIADLEKTPGTRQGTGVGFVGVLLGQLTPEVRVQLNDFKGQGVLVAQVTGGSPADDAGINAGDVIQRINGKDVAKVEDAVAAIRATKPGQTLSLNIWSGGVKKLVTVKVQERPAALNVPQPQETP